MQSDPAVAVIECRTYLDETYRRASLGQPAMVLRGCVVE
jgi:hypothetical protein